MIRLISEGGKINAPVERISSESQAREPTKDLVMSAFLGVALVEDPVLKFHLEEAVTDERDGIEFLGGVLNSPGDHSETIENRHL
eukprot:CAMPEP_0177683072 /NCGR_PEP_ID=MMETSP0447-20121125/31596_1 /TAXON_ID=0 /ORGANISM="Stygamoeba regulata, Strain BSH-02190019" /LENGTH=84 /DNA_ID=CAMNT_0019192615 /DNA_START=14 /DNA_END=269 /DNA_ORIENTATION=+